jgi:ADP-heptose:LPS heptosyltransferase
VDLTGRTSFIELAGLGAEAALYVGNDTGPAHVVAYAGAPGVMLLSGASDPVHVGPRGPTTVLKAEKLSEIDWPQVLETLLARASAA